jgi:predicted transposase YbfD/YdcC
MQPCQEDNRSFFEKLQSADGLDLRDKRGKRHDLAVILTGVTIALLCNRDGNLSAIWRHLNNHYGKLVEVLGVEQKRAVSRAQLPRILEKVSLETFDKLIIEEYGIKLKKEERRWFAIDGKELRGSIEKGATKGETLVQAVEHESGQVYQQEVYSVGLSSEVKVVRNLLRDKDLAGQQISLDALHLKPGTLKPIVQAKGIYLVGLKENQKEMFSEAAFNVGLDKLLFQTDTVDKGHGRVEERKYRVFKFTDIYRDERWKGCQTKTLVKVWRERIEQRSGKKSQEVSYYVSNEEKDYAGLCQAIRGHWQVEVNNHRRDVSLQEDHLRSKKSLCKEHWQESEQWCWKY